ncbi:MAG TPA: isocitrate lyase/PEP mutase family protein [Burkholderiales bacterium]|nr:isocitrate lyase/PEP mutase family protein [Burkholderiales bacterium]
MTRIHPATQFRELLEAPGLIRGINIYDPLTARVAQQVGFKAIALGGYQQGSALCVPEPTLTMTEVIEGARLITKAVSIPLKVDCGAGFGEAVHVTRTIREAEAANIACLHIEDQHYPKRAHYHRFEEEVIDIEEMLAKLKAAIAARTTDLVIVGRTDAIHTHGVKEAIHRGILFAEAGCDMVEVFPNTVEDAQVIAREVKAPLIYVNSAGNRKGRPVFSWQELEDMGYKMCIDSATVILSAVEAVRDSMMTYMQTGRPPERVATNMELRRYIETLIGLEEYYDIEERTLGLGKHAIR